MRITGRSKLKDDGVNISDWLTALCLFTSHAAKQFSGVDLVALAQYLANQLRAGEGLDLLLLKELVAVMTVRAATSRTCLRCNHDNLRR